MLLVNDLGLRAVRIGLEFNPQVDEGVDLKGQLDEDLAVVMVDGHRLEYDNLHLCFHDGCGPLLQAKDALSALQARWA